jgi:biotin carboxyl carrier protein
LDGRRSTDKPSRAQPGHEGHGHGRAGLSSNGTGAPARSADRSRSVATSPAVGIFQPGTRATSGTRVRTGDSLGSVNVLGVPQDVTAPADGIVGSTLVEAGTAVEYGQELIRIELTGAAVAPAAPTPAAAVTRAIDPADASAAAGPAEAG